jgi:hypothetical protein
MIHYDVQLIGGMVLHEGKIERCKRVKENISGYFAAVFNR